LADAAARPVGVYEEEPLPKVLALAEHHFREEHGVEFDPRQHLYWEQNRPAEPLAHYLTEAELQPPGFRCALCEIRHFVEPSYGDPDRNAALRRHYRDQLGPLLRGLSMEEQERVIEDWDRGRLARANLERLERTEAMRTKRPADPETTRRKQACQAFLLGQYRQLGTVEAALDALEALTTTDPDLHLELVGRGYPFARETYRAYWREIAPSVRQRAGADARRQAEERRAQRRRKLTP
jgi:hypothetical protein